MPPFSFSAETLTDLERLLGRKPELIANLVRHVAPAGFIPGPVLAHVRKRDIGVAFQWRRLRRALVGLRRALDSLSYAAGEDLDTGFDGLWEYEHNRKGPDTDLAGLAAHTAYVNEVLEWAMHHKKTRRGRPGGIATDRKWLGTPVAMSLREAGFRLTKGRDGILARTLAVLFDVAELGVPEDMFDCVRSIVREVEAIDRRRRDHAAAKKGALTKEAVSPKTLRLAPPKPSVE